MTNHALPRSATNPCYRCGGTMRETGDEFKCQHGHVNPACAKCGSRLTDVFGKTPDESEVKYKCLAAGCGNTGTAPAVQA